LFFNRALQPLEQYAEMALSKRVMSAIQGYYEAMWIPLKIYINSKGKKSFYLQHQEKRVIKKGFFPDNVPIYRENPKYLEYYCKSRKQFVSRQIQIGDRVYTTSQKFLFGECIDEKEESITIIWNNGTIKKEKGENILVAHHQLLGLQKKDTESILKNIKIS
jgi:hypothetical protein